MSDAFQSVPNVARLIDPEDARINLAINDRGFFVRCGINRRLNLLKDGWKQTIIDAADQILLMSYDQRIIKDSLVDYGTLVVDFGNCIGVIFVSSSNSVFFHFWSKSYNTSSNWCDWVVKTLFLDKVVDVFDEESNQRDISFWGLSGSEYEAFNRKVTLRAWNDVVHNYPPTVLTQLETLRNIRPPIEGGKIILMHGEPGTGKTSFLQVLAREWTKWCHTSYITDPENFLGMTGSMLNVLTWNFDEYISSEVDKKNAYHLLIIEDADELISADARRQSGQALSRLLNIGDGLLGQSTNLLICITTNVNITDLHPAVSRAGRCLAKIEFTKFSHSEAVDWVKHHSSEIDSNITLTKPHHEGYSLAELYEILAGSKQIQHVKQKATVGQYL